LVNIRKIQRLGSSSLIITIPKDWARRTGLKPGDSVYIIERENELRLIPFVSEQDEGLPVTVKVSGPSPLVIQKTLSCVLRLGFKKLNLVFDPPLEGRLLDEVEKLIRENGNYMILEKTYNQVKLKMLVDPYRVDHGLLMRELMSITSRNIDHMVGILEGDVSDLDEKLAESHASLRDIVGIRDKVANILILRIDSVKGDAKEERRRVLSLNSFLLTWSIIKTINEAMLEAMERYKEIKITDQHVKNLLVNLLRGIDNALWESIGALSNESSKRATAARDILFDLEKTVRKLEDYGLEKIPTPLIKFVVMASHVTHQLHQALDMVECLINIEKMDSMT